ncbi:3-dehydroquinate synthase [Alkalicoccus urumqiensis]|uniref:3-dehydroquinate synthase n=1 Tax=Alkalicoccus urumqiensis TaxID=1548213 RepID=A0A2P6MKK4_ALKUR|nr:3-dehydroquinate synthase [Alkalicoccus urumqiensis]PRO66814.1 3-dehydroquinate synthase [Alkalicoccus urumqiensis]
MGHTLEVRAEARTYPIHIEGGVRHRVGSLVNASVPGHSRVLIAADEHAASHYLEDIAASFAERPDIYIIPSGEESKSQEEYFRLLTAALEAGLDRKSVICALGGGVTGDLAGFAAATFMRGISFVQIPTTLLAHDSSVGGKTGINHAAGKNLIGSFHAPSAVIYDPETFETLPERELRSGFAEVIKHAWISGDSWFSWLDQFVPSLTKFPKSKMEELLSASIQVKARIVEEDEREKGKRAFLNFGHTLGHALESAAGYGRFTHGEAVAVGMLFAAELSRNILKADLPIHELKQMLTRLGYTTEIDKHLRIDDLIRRMRIDKKAADGTLRFVLLHELGRPELCTVPEEEVRKLLEKEGLT